MEVTLFISHSRIMTCRWKTSLTLLITLNDSLDKLAELDERQSKIIEMRFFGGLTQKEIAEHFEISERTVMRDWRSAKLWLLRDINGE